MTYLLAALMFYYQQINNGNATPSLIHDYAIVESKVAGLDQEQINEVTTVIQGESQFVPTKIHYNDAAIGCDSVGLVQIRDCNHPDITLQQAENPIFAVNFLIDNIDKCDTWWLATCPRTPLQGG